MSLFKSANVFGLFMNESISFVIGGFTHLAQQKPFHFIHKAIQPLHIKAFGSTSKHQAAVLPT